MTFLLDETSLNQNQATVKAALTTIELNFAIVEYKMNQTKDFREV
tara:strand:- start:370 stop:504 length:135 start_codon:yes stop_codon:yes gene_type:complete